MPNSGASKRNRKIKIRPRRRPAAQVNAMVKTKKYNGHAKGPTEPAWRKHNGEKVILVNSPASNDNSALCRQIKYSVGQDK